MLEKRSLTNAKTCFLGGKQWVNISWYVTIIYISLQRPVQLQRFSTDFFLLLECQSSLHSDIKTDSCPLNSTCCWFRYLKVSPGPMSKKYSSCSTIFIDDNTVSQPNLKSTIKWWENFTHTQARTMLCCPKVSHYTWENPVASQRGNLEVILNGCMTETAVLTPNLGQSFVLPWFWWSCKTTFHQDYLSVYLNEASVQEVRHRILFTIETVFIEAKKKH